MNMPIREGLFEASETTSWVLAKNLIEWLDQYDLRKKIIAYVKDEGANLNAMIVILKSMVDCEVISMEESFQGGCFGHLFYKACQYGTTL
jgi:hypothetical protein